MSTLMLTFGKLRAEVQRYMGFGRGTDWDNLTADAKGDVLSVIERGLRQFYNPMPLPNESSAHEWSFLRGFGVVTTAAPYSTGTITTSGTTVTGSGTTFTAAMVGRTIHANGESRLIDSYSSGTGITVDRAFSSDLLTANTFEVYDFDHELPADFGGLKGQVTYEDGEGNVPLQWINESAIRIMRSEQSIRKDEPEYFALVPKTVVAGTTSQQRFELTIWPAPDAVYDLLFAYTVMTDSISDNPAANADDGNYPVGAMVHSETILASCLSVAEQMVDEFNNPGKMQARFIERLSASISYDRRNALPDGFGYNHDNSDRAFTAPSRRRLQTVSYKDVIYP
jgi:hypothetical protein